MEIKINRDIITSCRDCIFAECAGNEQTGCSFDRLDKFEENGAEIVGQDDLNKRYFLVVGRFCNACRNHNWGTRHPPKDWHSIVAREFSVRCCFIIYVDKNITSDQVDASLDSVLWQGATQPYSILILLNGATDPVITFIHMIREKKVEIPWQVRDLVVDHPGQSIDYGAAIDIGVKSIEGATYYCVSRAGYMWPPNYLTVFNDAVNYKMTRIISLLPDLDGNGLLMSVALHNKLLFGNADRPVTEKLLEAADFEGTTHMIKTWQDLNKQCM